MKLHLQFGFGMMSLSRELFERWGGGIAILSPRDLKPAQLENISAELISLNGQILIDPQFYLPRADHPRLTSYDYWPQDYDTQGFSDASREIMLQKLHDLNKRACAYALIVPGERAETVDDLWLESQDALLRAAKKSTELPLIVTICLSSEAIRSSDQINLIIERAEYQEVYGYYLVLEHPAHEYFVNDPQWMANTLDLAAGLTKLGANVIVGYSNQQQLIMACAGVAGIASGTWMNVRSFFPAKFRVSYEDEIKRRTTWYYCPQALSEYTLPFLDVGVRLGLRDILVSDPKSDYAASIFASQQPSASGWEESFAFRHYLDILNIQVASSSFASFDDTFNYQNYLLNKAEALLKQFRANGVSGQTRDFSDGVAASRAALIVLRNTHGPILNRRWKDFIK